MSEYAEFGAPVRRSSDLPASRVAGPVEAGSVAGGTRLTRRGRLVVVLLSAGLLLAAFSLGRADTQAATTLDAPGSALTQTVVLPGDTLWSIAQDLAPDNDPREVVALIRELNDLTGALVAGQQLLLPAVA